MTSDGTHINLQTKNYHDPTPMNHTLLPDQFTEGEFQFKRVDRIKDIAIYEKKSTKTRYFGYEVIRIRIADAATLPSGKSYPKREVYPRSEAWGTDGFTCVTFQDAQKRLGLMLNQ